MFHRRNKRKQIFQYSFLIALFCSLEIRVDVRLRGHVRVSLHETSKEDSPTDFRLIRIWPRGSGRPEVDREKLSSHLRLSTDESLQAPPLQLGGSSIESRAFLLFIWQRRAHSRIWRTKRRRRGLSCIERGETAYLPSSAPGNSLRSQIKCHSPRQQANCTKARTKLVSLKLGGPRTHVSCVYRTAKSVRNLLGYLLTPG